jgi:hypothetical protein
MIITSFFRALILLLIIIIIIIAVLRVELKALARQVIYHLNHDPAL